MLRHHYERHIENAPGEANGETPSAYVLAAGYTRDSPWVIKINPNGLLNHFEDIGFHAIGTAAPMAQQAGALLAHFRMIERSIDHGVVVVIRVLDALAQDLTECWWSA